MTNTQPPSFFNARSDSAAAQLKASMVDARTGKPLQPRPVPVDANGQPERPLPPEGSYMRQAIEQKRARDREQAVQAAQRGGANHQAQGQPQDPSQQGQVPAPDGQSMDDQQPTADDQQLSGNAQKRIRELSQALRQKEQELQQVSTQLRAGQETQAQTKARLEALENQYQQ